MKDIKELALKVAGMPHNMGPHDTSAFTTECITDFATRLIAAYTEGQEPVAMVVDGGGELHLPKLQWVSANHSLETPTGSKLFTAPPEPAPQQKVCVTCGGTCEQFFCNTFKDRSDYSAHQATACAALSSEEVKEMVERLRELSCCFEKPWQSDYHKAADLIERLAARVPDGCVVVPREPTEAMIGNEWNRDMLTGIWKAMIAAGEVK